MTVTSIYSLDHDARIDWRAAHDRLRAKLSGMLYRRDAELIEDLTAEALSQLIRANRRIETIDDLDSLMQVIARRTLVNYLRRTQQERAVVHLPADANLDVAPALAVSLAELEDTVTRLRELAVEYFTNAQAEEAANSAPDMPACATQGQTGATTRSAAPPTQRLAHIRPQPLSCLDLLHAYLASLDWVTVAARFGRTHDGIRKRWSRCRAALIAEARQPGSPLHELVQ